jgi:acyl-coenzyme A synthetase/AMP-(fatty) acid ligase
MKNRLSDAPTLAALMAPGAGRGRRISTRDWSVSLDDLASQTCLGAELAQLEGRRVALAVGDMAKAAAALIELDGLARQIVLCPPGVDTPALAALIRAAGADALVAEADAPEIAVAIRVACRLPLTPLAAPRRKRFATEWILPTSGTSGPPKLVAHTLATLTAPVRADAGQRWATFYDIRRYGGLQIFLRALAGVESLTLSDPSEGVDAFLVRLAHAGATHISGTPSHWRKVLMSAEARRIAPQGVRLSGEIADDAVLASLRALYPRAHVEHAYASTEAGVAFAVADGRAGFPAALIDESGDVAIRIEDDTLRIRSNRSALRYVGENAPLLKNAEGFVDTGDVVERRGERYLFAGRRGGVINVGGAKVHPEEVEAALNAHAAVSASRVFSRKNAITGALVAAEVVLRAGAKGDEATKREILAACRALLPAHKAPSSLSFVAELPITDGGKLVRHG